MTKNWTIGYRFNDSRFIKLQKSFLINLSLLMSCGALVWGLIAVYYGLYLQSTIPFAYVLISALNISYFSKSKNLSLAGSIQLFTSLVLPFVFQWLLGGYQSSGIIMLWAFVALISSVSLLDSHRLAILCLVMFIALSTISAYYDDYFKTHFKPDILQGFSINFLVFNVCSICSIVFGLVFFFLRNQKNTYKRLEEKTDELERTNSSLNKANRAKSQFLANVSHEIRTPLNGIIGTTGLLKETKITEEQSQLLENLDHSGTILHGLISDVLDISQIEENKLVLNTSAVNVNKEARKIFEIFKLQITEKRELVVLKIEYDIRIPEYLKCDTLRLNQILINLLNNAIKYTKEGAIILKTELVEKSEFTSIVKFSVEDTGIGIPENLQDQIFNQFYQVNEIAEEGTGLGLSITRSIIKAMGGKIDFSSIPGKGSVFWFEVPLSIADAPLSQKYASVKVASNKEIPILIVEDNPINMMIAKKILLALGYKNISTAEDGIIAYEATKKESFTLILMDINMPKMNGVEATKKIFQYCKKHNISEPIIGALTANALKNEQQEYLDMGMSFVLSKPFVKEDLEQKINEYTTIN